jgi:hypothetical protein
MTILLTEAGLELGFLNQELLGGAYTTLIMQEVIKILTLPKEATACNLLFTTTLTNLLCLFHTTPPYTSTSRYKEYTWDSWECQDLVNIYLHIVL